MYVSLMSHRFRTSTKRQIKLLQAASGKQQNKLNLPNNQMNARYHLLLLFISVGSSLLSTAASFVVPSVGTSATACSMSSMKQTAADMDIISPTTLGPTIL